MRRVVVDTSVLAASRSMSALSRWGGHRWCQLYAPTLLRYEMQNVAPRRCRRAPEAARPSWWRSAVFDATRGITWMDPNPTDVALLAHATGLSAYDASYLWLAGFVGADLVTADRQLAEAFDAFAAR